MGPVINQGAVDLYLKSAEEARKSGKLLFGGKQTKEGDFARGFFVEPAIAELPKTHRLFQEELFLPFLVVTGVDSFEEALTEANNSAYGLCAGIYSHDKKEIAYFFDHVQAGGMVISGLITAFMLATGAIAIQSVSPDCSGVGSNECVGQIFGAALGSAIGLILVIALVFLAFVAAAWFLTGLFAGRQAIRHIRRLEPGITNSQSRSVSLGWGCGALVAVAVMIAVLGILASALGL